MAKFIYLFILILCVNSQNIETADKLFSQQNWKEAKKIYIHVDKDSAVFFKLGIIDQKLKNYDTSIQYLKEAEKANFSKMRVHYNLAKNFMALNKTKKGLAHLEKSTDQGLPIFNQVKNEPLFNSVSETKKFKSLLKQIKTNGYPCLNNPKMRIFDFWIGTWDVYVNNNLVGVNKITKANGGCALHEDYISTGAYTGQSINFYDPFDGKWKQHWVGTSGDVMNFVETYHKVGEIQFVAHRKSQTGSLFLTRLTFTHNPKQDTVRQLFEQSTDNGKTWKPTFDGLYKKANRSNKN